MCARASMHIQKDSCYFMEWIGCSYLENGTDKSVIKYIFDKYFMSKNIILLGQHLVIF